MKLHQHQQEMYLHLMVLEPLLLQTKSDPRDSGQFFSWVRTLKCRVACTILPIDVVAVVYTVIGNQFGGLSTVWSLGKAYFPGQFRQLELFNCTVLFPLLQELHMASRSCS